MVTAAQIGLFAVQAVYGSYATATAVRYYSRTKGRPVPPLTRRIIAELRPFVLTLVMSQYILGTLARGSVGWWLIFATGLNLFGWWLGRNDDDDDDDRWKRRRHRIAERMAQIHARLTIVPATTG